MISKRSNKRRGVSITGPWVPCPLDFWRSRAFASLSPHACKLLNDCLALLGPNAHGNGDLCLSHGVMRKRGWSGRETLGAAIRELEAAKLLIRTRHGSRLDCSLWALTLYPLDCDLDKLDVRPGSYTTGDWRTAFLGADKPPTDNYPATWARTRKLKTVAPPRDDMEQKRPATGRTSAPKRNNITDFVPPRDETPTFSGSNRPATGYLSRVAICTRSESKQPADPTPARLRLNNLPNTRQAALATTTSPTAGPGIQTRDEHD